MRVVMIAPHPDDDIIGAGGSLAIHARRGAQVTTVHLVARDCSMLDDDIDDERFQDEIAQANKMIGVRDCVQFGASPRDLSASRQLRLAIVEVLRRTRPSVVYIPHADEADQEHALTHQLAMDGLWMASSRFFAEAGSEPSPPPVVLGYEVWTPMRRFQYAEDIEETLEAKVAAMGAYRSQLRHVDWQGAIRGLAAYRGALTLGGGAAEVFEVVNLPRGQLRATSYPRDKD